MKLTQCVPFLVFVLLNNFNNGNAEPSSCGPNSAVKLSDIHLDLTLVEPRETISLKLWSFLIGKGIERETHFESTVRSGFKSATIERVIVDDKLTGDPFQCLSGPSKLNSPVPQRDVGVLTTQATLLGAALTPAYLEKRRTDKSAPKTPGQSERIDDDDDHPVLRVIVMFTETYATGESKVLNEDSTCRLGHPAQKDVKDYFSKKGIHFLLVTPRATTEQKWREVFDAEDAHVYPDLTHKLDMFYSPERDTMADFVRDRTLKFACKSPTLTTTDEKDNNKVPVASNATSPVSPPPFQVVLVSKHRQETQFSSHWSSSSSVAAAAAAVRFGPSSVFVRLLGALLALGATA